jgi:hypothetical protein
MAETSKSRTKKKAAKTKNETHKKQENLLNRELEDSFPASDPLSLTQPTTEMGGPDRKRHKAKSKPEPKPIPARPSLRRPFRISAHQIRKVRLASVALRALWGIVQR